MIFNNLKEAIQFRIIESEENYWIEDYWKAATEIFSKNIFDTIDFIKYHCSDEEFYWLSEIFEDLVDKTQSKELIQVLRSRLASVNPESYNQQSFKSEHMRKYIDYEEYIKSINMEIEYAEAMLDD